MKYIAVKNFAEHQHYRDRVPPWIKFYNRVLDDYAFLQLSDASRSHLMLMWLLASRHKNRIPYDEKFIAAKISARGKIDFAGLFASGFLVLVEDAASAVLATDDNDASKTGDAEESRGREEKEGEQNTPPKSRTKAEAGQAFAAIRRLIREQDTQGSGRVRFIPAADVEKLGAVALTAYERIGGSARFLDQKERVGFLLRDFESAYRAVAND